jgi:predicted nuclease of predicted toxin-antitoxin system
MNFLTDENFPLASSKMLEQNGHKVRSVSVLFKGYPDLHILKEAIEHEEFIISFDKDFGELIFKYNFPHPPGIILFRIRHFSPESPAFTIIKMISENIYSFEGYFTVIGKNKTRQKSLSKKNN